MNNTIKRTWNQNSMVIIEDLQGMAFQAESGGHTFQISGIDGEGNAVALSGTPAGVMLRADGQDVTLTCSVSGGVVSATLPANAYSVPGRFGLTIFLTSDGQKTAIYAAVGTVGKTSSGTVAPPAGSDVVDLVNQINTAIAAIPANYNACFAPAYSTSGLYSVGQYVTYNGNLYRCNTAITTAETWTAAHWTQTNLGADVYDLKSALSQDLVTVSGYVPIVFTEKNRYTLKAAGETIDINNTDPIDTIDCAKVSVVPGDTVVVLGTGISTSSSRLYAYTDSNGVCIERASGVMSGINRLTAPAGSAYLLLNVKRSDHYYAFKGDRVSNSFVKANKKTDDLTDNTVKSIEYTQDCNVIYGNNDFEVGNLSDAGQTVDAVNRLRTKTYIDISSIAYLRVHINGDKYNYRIFLYDSQYGNVSTPDGSYYTGRTKTYNVTGYSYAKFAIVNPNATGFNFIENSGAINEVSLVLKAENQGVIDGTLNPVRIRACTYNVGKYAMGGAPSSLTHEDYDRIIPAYRKIYSELGADILGLQEEWITMKPTSGDTTADAAIYNYLYPYHAEYDENSRPAIKSQYKIYNIGTGSFVSSGRPYIYGEISVNGISVFVMSVHLGLTLAVRQSEQTELLAILAQHNYFIVFGDFNAGTGNEGGVSEYDAYKTAGYHLANVGYLGEFSTHPTSQHRDDNIITSSNIVIANSFVGSDGSTLNSDHLPFVADLVVYPI